MWFSRRHQGEMRLRRYALVGVVDVWSRRVMYQLAPVSSSAAITQLLRRALTKWGVPEVLRLDNGRDYASERVALMAGALAIRIEHCRPFHPEEKPFIERAFRTVSVAMEMLPGYVGHSVAERQQLRARERARVRAGEAPVDLGSAPLARGVSGVARQFFGERLRPPHAHLARLLLRGSAPIHGRAPCGASKTKGCSMCSTSLFPGAACGPSSSAVYR